MNQSFFSHAQFGIDELYVHDGFPSLLLEKLHRRAELTLDGEDKIVSKNGSHDMILIFYKRVPSPSVIYRFLESLDKHPGKGDYIKSNTLLNEEDLFLAIKEKKFILVTRKILLK